MDLRVALIDDEELAIRRLELALATIGGCQVVGKASDGDAGRTMVDELAPDVLIVDIHMPGLDGIQLVESLEGDDPPVVIFAPKT